MSTLPSSGAFIDPPPRAPLLFRLGTRLAERIAGKRLLLARILAWYPRAAFGAGVLEATITNRDGRIDQADAEAGPARRLLRDRLPVLRRHERSPSP